jgi:5-formyltetrahydrofolate cyclo-ligase
LSKFEKENVRRYVWNLLETEGAALFPKPIVGRIPNFVGAEKAAELLRTLPEYQKAKTIACNPDSPQRPVRGIALKDGKRVVMATPRLKKGFILLDPTTIPKNRLGEAATIRGAFKYGRPVDPSQLKVDLFIAGSVAVSLDGGRLGKGTGYSDQEYAILRSMGAITPNIPVVTTVHSLQVVEEIPRENWDVPVNIIITPTRIHRLAYAIT